MDTPETVFHQDLCEPLCDLQHDLGIIFTLNSECMLKYKQFKKRNINTTAINLYLLIKHVHQIDIANIQPFLKLFNIHNRNV